MNGREEDTDLARLFEELRRADDAKAPPFRQVLEKAKAAQNASSRLLPLRVAAVAAVLAIAALTAVFLRRPAREAAGQDRPVTVAQWKSPTDWLLRTPGSEILDELPAWSGLVLNYAGPKPSPMKSPRETPMRLTSPVQMLRR